jgi:hypothetical protein
MMFEQWSEFYMMAGSAAAVLIGLIFVVVTLMQDRSRSSVLAGSKLYMGPVLLHVAFVLALSAAALTPGISARWTAGVAGVIAIWGLVRAGQSAIGIYRLRDEYEAHWTDVWFYGVAPGAIFAALALVAAGFWGARDWAAYGLAVVITALLLLTVRNEWDLVTWLAPRKDEAGEE